MNTLEEKYKSHKDTLPDYLDIYASQEGEDILLKRILKQRYFMPGIYIDIGAHHPIRFSNTVHYYMRGWHGVNFEPNEEMIVLFKNERPRDISLNLAIGEKNSATFYRFEEPAFNTFDEFQRDYALTKTSLIEAVEIEKIPLAEALDENLPQDDINNLVFFNIDVEGAELEVLTSNNWIKYRPLMILVEILNDKSKSDIFNFLIEKEYFFVARTKNTYFFAEKNYAANNVREWKLELEKFLAESATADKEEYGFELADMVNVLGNQLSEMNFRNGELTGQVDSLKQSAAAEKQKMQGELNQLRETAASEKQRMEEELNQLRETATSEKQRMEGELNQLRETATIEKQKMEGELNQLREISAIDKEKLRLVKKLMAELWSVKALKHPIIKFRAYKALSTKLHRLL